MTDLKIQAILRNYQRKWSIERKAITAYIQTIWSRIGRKHTRAERSEITVVFLNDTQIRHYNKQYRKKDASTDVLSFPVDEIMDQRHYLGDVLISLERTAAQAEEKSHGFDRELKILLLHGMLHLLGYDHETDNGRMERLERRLRKELIPQ